MGFRPTKAELRDWERRGMVPAGTADGRQARRVELVPAAFHPPACWVLPLATANETNARTWQARNRRAGAAWRAVRGQMRLSQLVRWERRVLKGQPVACHFTRLGGRRLDPMVGLPAALKGVEDAVCYLLGLDDGSPLWQPSCGQEPGTGGSGVRVELAAGAAGGER